MATMVSVRRKESCDGYKGQLRTYMVLWWIKGLPIDHKDVFCGHSVRHSAVMASWIYWGPQRWFKFCLLW